MGWGKLNRKCQVSNRFFGGAPKSLTAIKGCLVWELVILTFGGRIFYVWELRILTFGGQFSYLWGLVFLTFGG